MALDMKKFIDRFVEEARDHLGVLGDGLAVLDHNPEDRETLNTVFRSAHTVKGSSRMLKLFSINETAHKLEDVLDALRTGGLSWSPELSRVLYLGVDALAVLVDHLARGEALPPANPRVLAALDGILLPSALEGVRVPSASGPSGGPESAIPSGPVDPGPLPDTAPVSPDTSGSHAASRLRTPDTVRVRLDKLDELVKLMNEVVASHARSRQRLVEARALERLALPGNTGKQESQDVLRQEIRRFSQQMRDDMAVQDLLMDELHHKTLVMRMLPLAMVFDPMARMVRDIATGIGKDVECVVKGAEIELDRQMMDTLGDPILHLLRNAVDHGIETPELRKAKGKPARGRVSLSARQDGAWVLIEIADDGAGIPVEAIREKVLRKGLASRETVEASSDREIMDYIFQPGFSTSPIITDLSGRGVGLDVVRSSIVEVLQGMVAVDSRQEEGTVFSLRLPLSLAVMHVLLVRCGGFTFGFTAQYLEEMVHSEASEFREVAGRRVLVLRNEFIPVLGLDELLDLPETLDNPAKSDRFAQGILLLVVGMQGEKLALAIESLLDEGDMVIKPLPKHLQKIGLASGMVSTGKNELVNILHVPALLARAQAVRGQRAAAGSAPRPGDRKKVIQILVVDDSLNTREIERDVLEAYGYQVTLAEHGLDGLRKSREKKYDAVLTDVEMPHMDGFTLTSQLRQDPDYADTPIIILSSRQKEEDKRRGIQVGADAYMVKGDFEQGNLVELLRNFGL